MTLHQQLFTADYIEQQRILHREPDYGTASLKAAPIVAQIIPQLGAKSICDFGAGKCRLGTALKSAGLGHVAYHPYDPAFPEYGPPQAADLLCCIDVMEHVEEQFVASTISLLSSLALRAAFVTVHTAASTRFLADGRNAHLIQRPASWWLPKFCADFEIKQLQTMGPRFWLLAAPSRTA